MRNGKRWRKTEKGGDSKLGRGWTDEIRERYDSAAGITCIDKVTSQNIRIYKTQACVFFLLLDEAVNLRTFHLALLSCKRHLSLFL